MEHKTQQLPSVGAALVVFLSMLVSNFALAYLAVKLNWQDHVVFLVTPLAMFALTLVMAKGFRVSFRTTFNLDLPSGSDLLVAFPLAISLVVINQQMTNVSFEMFPVLKEHFDLEGGLRAQSTSDWIRIVVGTGFGAALSEEFLFRGFILNGFRQRLNRRAAIVWSAFLFTLLHVLPLPSVFLAGIVLGIASIATGSIWIPVLIHFINNAAAIALSNLVDTQTFADELWLPPGILVPATLLLAVTVGYYVRQIIGSEDPAPRDETIPPAEASEPLQLPAPPTLSEELSRVPPERRLIGWIVVVAASASGLIVLLGLFAYTVYVGFPAERHAEVIDYLEEQTVGALDAETQTRRPEVETAYQTLSTANDDGNVTFGQLWTVVMAFAQAKADGNIDDSELDGLFATIQGIIDQAKGEHL